MAGAAEVQEDRQLKVDLPIDQVKHGPIQYCGPDEVFSIQSLNTLVLFIWQEVRIDFSLEALLLASP